MAALASIRLVTMLRLSLLVFGRTSELWECNSVGRVLQREGILLLNALGRGFEPHHSHFLTRVPRVQGVFEGVYKNVGALSHGVETVSTGIENRNGRVGT